MDHWINRGKTISNGTELTLQHSFGKIRSYTNYTYINSEDQDGKPIPEIARHSANAGFEYAFTPQIQLNVRGNYLGNKLNPQLIPATGNELVEDAVVVNTGLSYLNVHNFDFYLDVKNIFDAKYYHTSNLEPARYRQPQRSMLLRIDYKY